jgi:hypothetical protein
MEIFATGLSSPECPILLDNGALLVVEMRQDRSAITTCDMHPIKLTRGFANGKFSENGRLFCTVLCTSPRSLRELWRSTTWTSTACPSSGD